MRKRLYLLHRLCSVLLITAIITITATPAFAWLQPIHRAINDQAINKFKTVFNSNEKYKTAPINYDEFYQGVGISSRFYFANTYKATKRTMQLPEWIVNGGDWADEPEWYASVRHFFDPLALSGVNYLTDHSYAFGTLYEQPKIDAMTWALSHNDNPFNWHNALINYKKAMEIPEDGKLPETIKGQHFKLNVAIQPKDRKEEREFYLAYAYRALGETMHLMADMTQPAHVRNDSHPYDEPVEDTITADNVREFAASSSVDARMTENFISAGGSRLFTPENLFTILSSFTNKNFYSSDTIYDKDNGVMPKNDEIPIPDPQFHDLIPGEMVLNGTTISYLGAPFLNDVIPMIQEKVSGRIFKSKSYFVPSDNNFTKKMGSVLIPIAIAACSDLIHQFYPTLELQAKFEEPELLYDEVKGKPTVRYDIETTGSMIHKVEADQAWQEAGLSITYAGAGELVFDNNSKTRKIIPLAFEYGQLDSFQNSDKEWTEEPPILYLRQDTGVKYSKDEAYTAIEDGDLIYIRINAGSRTWTGPSLYYKFPVETLEADYTDNGLREEEGNPGFGVRELTAFAEAVNFNFEDTEDVIYLDPLYTGIVDLVFEDEKGYVRKTIPVWFEDGELSKISDTEGLMVNEPLLLYGDETAEYEFNEMEKLYEIMKDDSVYFRIKIDNDRELKSESWSYQTDEIIDGEYYGNITLEATQKFRDFVVNAISYIAFPIFNGILSAMDKETMSIEEIRSIVDSATTSEAVNAEIYLKIVTESGNKVAIDFYIYDTEGNPTVTSSKGTYKDGKLKFKAEFEDGSALEMEGLLRGDVLTGTLEGNAWAMVTQALDGNWDATKSK